MWVLQRLQQNHLGCLLKKQISESSPKLSQRYSCVHPNHLQAGWECGGHCEGLTSVVSCPAGTGRVSLWSRRLNHLFFLFCLQWIRKCPGQQLLFISCSIQAIEGLLFRHIRPTWYLNFQTKTSTSPHILINRKVKRVPMCKREFVHADYYQITQLLVFRWSLSKGTGKSRRIRGHFNPYIF